MNSRVLMLAIGLSMAGAVQAAAPAASSKPANAPAAAMAGVDGERAQVLAWTHELEADPMAADAAAKRAWLMQWLKDVRGLKVHVCDVFGVLGQQNKKVSSLMLQQYIFGSASYLIQHPSLGGREMAVQLAGVNSAMNAYAVLRKQDPLQRVGQFEQLLELQAKGGLPEYVESTVFEKCNKH